MITKIKRGPEGPSEISPLHSGSVSSIIHSKKGGR